MNDTTLTLDRLTIGRHARVDRVSLDGERGMQLLEMGMTPGTSVAVARIAPLGDPMDVIVRGYHLSLRRSEARQVTVIPRSSDDATD